MKTIRLENETMHKQLNLRTKAQWGSRSDGCPLDAFCSSGPSPTDGRQISPRLPQIHLNATLQYARVHLLGRGAHTLFVVNQLKQARVKIVAISLLGETMRTIGFDWLDLFSVLRTRVDFSTYAPTERLGLYEAITQVGADWVIDTRSDSEVTIGDIRNTHEAVKSLGCHLTGFVAKRSHICLQQQHLRFKSFDTSSGFSRTSIAAVTARIDLNRSSPRGWHESFLYSQSDGPKSAANLFAYPRLWSDHARCSRWL